MNPWIKSAVALIIGATVVFAGALGVDWIAQNAPLLGIVIVVLVGVAFIRYTIWEEE